MAPTSNWTLATLLEGMSDDALPALAVQGVCLDSRLVESGDLYLLPSVAQAHMVCALRRRQLLQVPSQSCAQRRIKGVQRHCRVAAKFRGACCLSLVIWKTVVQPLPRAFMNRPITA